ncbi:MAG: DsbA family protein [Minisyncoccota bacterium]
MKSSYTIPLAIALGSTIVAIAVYLSTPKQPSTSSGAGNPALVRPVGANDHILGNPAAPVKIVEYADFDCEYCKGFDDTLHQIIANEGASGKVAWVYRQFPLTEIHPDAMSLAEASECAAEAGGNDAFWKFTTALFKNQPANPTQYGTFAKEVGIPGDAFAACYADASTTMSARILADRQNAIAIGAKGTPYSLILAPGKPPVVIAGAYPYAAVKQLVEAALQDVR